MQERKPGSSDIGNRGQLVPGHRGITGNEAVDEEAKMAVRGGTSRVEDLPVVLRRKGKVLSLSHIKSAI